MWPPRKWAQRKPTGALIVFIQKGTPQRVAAKLRRKIAGAKLVFGKTSLSLLTLQYLEAEANERGLNHEDLG